MLARNRARNRKQPWQTVGVLLGVEVGQLDTALLQCVDLSRPFEGDLVVSKLSTQQARSHSSKAPKEVPVCSHE